MHAGRFEFIEVLGRGGMGEVWKARDPELGRVVAVKMLQRSAQEDLARFRREAQLTAKLNHPNIAQIYEFGENFIAMQYVDGQPIARPEHLAAAARAVHYAHQNGVLHRDLKPANILVDGAGRAYVLDFGLAREVRADATAMSLTGDILGTPSYMAPEQARGEVSRLDARTDIYGLGATLYALLEGRPPHTGPSAYEVVRKVIEDDPAPPKGDLGVIAMKAMEKDPERRYASAAAMADDLERWLRGEAIEARPASTLYRLGKRIRRQPVAWSLGAMLAAAVIGGSTFGVMQLVKRAEAEEAARLEAEARLRLADAQALVDEARALLADVDAAMYMEGCTLEPFFESLDRARELCSQALDRSPGFPPALYWTGMALRLEGDYDGAVDAMRRASETGDRRMRVALGRLVIERGLHRALATRTEDARNRHIAEATRELEAICAGIEDAGEGLEADLLRAWRLSVRLDQPELERFIDEAVERHGMVPGVEEFHFIRGRWVDGRPCVDAMEEALRIRPGYFIPAMEAGLALEAMGDREGALRHFDRAIEIQPRLAEARFNRGWVRRRGRDFPGALEDLTHALELRPEYPEALTTRGMTLHAMGRHAEAIADHTRAVELDPQFLEAFVNRSSARLYAGDYAGCRDDAGRAIELDPTLPEAWVNRGTARGRLGDPEGASADYREALRIAPPDWPYRATVEEWLRQVEAAGPQ